MLLPTQGTSFVGTSTQGVGSRYSPDPGLCIFTFLRRIYRYLNRATLKVLCQEVFHSAIKIEAVFLIVETMALVVLYNIVSVL